jgi:hypothetical protein
MVHPEDPNEGARQLVQAREINGPGPGGLSLSDMVQTKRLKRCIGPPGDDSYSPPIAGTIWLSAQGTYSFGSAHITVSSPFAPVLIQFLGFSLVLVFSLWVLLVFFWLFCQGFNFLSQIY